MMMMMMMMMLPNFSLRRQSSKRRGLSHSHQDKKVRKKIQKNQKICEIFFFEIFRKKISKNVQRAVVTKSILSLSLSLSLSAS